MRPVPGVAPEGEEAAAQSPGPQVPIVELLRDGQDIVVQVVKDPIGSKGARLTTQISIPSRYLVLLPQSKVIGVSARIEGEAERQRSRRWWRNCPPVMAATATSSAPTPKGSRRRRWPRTSPTCRGCGRGWSGVAARSRWHPHLRRPGPALRAVRDLMRRDVDKIKVDSRETYDSLCAFVAKYMPVLSERIEHYTGERPVFDMYGVEDEIGRALDKQVPLKSGGYLVIDQTEAMTTIDVNTGSFVGQRNLEETVYRTNLEAAQAVARQLRLRNLGGIIIIDFIDMDDPEHRRQVLRTLEKALVRDNARTTVYEFSPLGLVEMTRKRTVESLERQLSEPCPECGGRGSIKTAETVTYEIFREITRAVRQFEARAAAGDRIVEGGGAHHRGGVHRGGRTGGIPRQEHPFPGRRTVPAGTVRCRSVVKPGFGIRDSGLVGC